MHTEKTTFSPLKIALFSLLVAFSQSAFAADSAYLVDVTLPECNANNPEVQFISSNSDWSKINDSSKTIFCVKPGDYSGAGKVTLTADGTSSKRRYIVLDNGNDTHPAKLSSSQRANVRLFFSGANYWVVDRMSSIGFSNTDGVSKFTSSSNNILNRLFVKDYYQGIYIYDGSNNNTFQNSRFEDMTLAGRKIDRVAIALSSGGESNVDIYNTKIINNEIKNANDGVQLIRSSHSGSYVTNINYDGTIVDSNKIWITPDIYTDGSGHADPNGKYAYAENAIDIKAGSKDPSHPVLITNNHVWGMRHPDRTDASISGQGKAMTIHFGVTNTRIENNVIFDAEYGVAIGDSANMPYAMSDSTVKNNIFYQMGRSTPKDSYTLYAYDVKNLDISGNVFADSPNAKSCSFSSASNTNLTCNVFINMQSPGSPSGTVSDNSFYDTAAEANMEDYVFTTDIYTNSPRQIVLKGVVSTASSPHTCSLEAPVSESYVPQATETTTASEAPAAEEQPAAEEAGPFIMDVETKELR